MKKILTIMWKDVSVLFRDIPAVILIILAPLILTIGMGLVTGSFNRSGETESIGPIPVIIVDRDGGPFAESLIDIFTSQELSELITPEQWEDEEAALEDIRNGGAAAAIVIPAGFSDSFMPDATGRLPAAVALRVHGDPGSPISVGIVRSIAEEFTARIQTNVTAVQVALTELALSGEAAPAELPEIGQAMGERLFNGEGETSNAALIAIRSESIDPTDEGGFNLLAYFAPAMALLFLMYAVTLGARTLLSERRDGTLARMLAAPVTPAQVLGGKVAGIFLGGFIQLAVIIVLTTILFRLYWGNPLGVFVLIVAAALAATGWGLLLASASTNAGQVSTLGMALTLIFGILGGSFIPNLQSGPILDALSRITPNYWAMDGFVALAAGDGLSAIYAPVTALLIMAVLLFVAAGVLFRRRQSSLLTG